MNKRKFAIDWSKSREKFAEQEKSKGFAKDERIFIPQFKSDGTFEAVIRFLPSKDTDVPFVELYNHGFQGPGGWFVENCPTTIKKKCPVCEANGLIWDDYPDIVRKRKRKLNIYSNILVVNDIQTPANNGKVFLFRYGIKIMEKIMAKWQPKEGGILKKVELFDYYEGLNFNLIIKKVKVGDQMMPNYDESGFGDGGVIGTDEEIEKIHSSLYGLKDFLAETNFKAYADLKEKHDRVIGQTVNAINTAVKAPETTNKIATAEKEDTTVTEDIFSGNNESFFEDITPK